MTALAEPTAVFPCSVLPFPGTGHPQQPGLEVVGAGRLVPLAAGGSIEYANLDHAASAPALHAVRRAVDTAVERYAPVNRGAGYHSRVTSAWYEGAREPVRAFVDARPDDALIFTRNSTDSFNLLAHCLPAGTTVFVFASEHHAALLPWDEHRVVRLAPPSSPDAALDALELALAVSDEGPKLVVVTGASNVTGEIWPIAEIAAIAHAGGARMALDAAQLAPHRPVSVQDLDVDYVVLSGHKLYAPYGSGALIGRADWLADAPPYLVGGGASATVTDTEVTWKPLPQRHEAGTPNVLGVIALATACHTLSQADPYALSLTEALLTERIREGLEQIDGVRVHTLWPDQPVDRIGVVTFTVAGLPSDLVAAALSAEYGIGVRDGAFCAQPLVRHLLTTAGVDAGHAVRASVGLASTTEHADRLVAAVADLATRGPALEYIDVNGRPEPVDGGRLTAEVTLPWT